MWYNGMYLNVTIIQHIADDAIFSSFLIQPNTIINFFSQDLLTHFTLTFSIRHFLYHNFYMTFIADTTFP